MRIEPGVAEDGRSAAVAGAVLAELRFPLGAARGFVLVALPLLALLPVRLLVGVLGAPAGEVPDGQRTVLLAIAGSFLFLIALAVLATVRAIGRRPSALVVCERAVVLRHRSRARVVPWIDLAQIDQRATRGVPTYVAVFRDGTRVPFGVGPAARDAAGHMVRLAGLTWVKEPFSARRA